MALMGNTFDRITAPSDGVVAARQAYATLWTDPEVLAVDEETDRFLALNRAVNDALEPLSAVDRRRAFTGTYDLLAYAESLGVPGVATTILGG